MTLPRTDLDQDRRVKKGVVTQLREFEGVTHSRLAGRDGGVAGTYTKMWLGGTPGKPPNYRFFGKHARGSRTQGVRIGAPVFASRFFVLPDWAPYATTTCKCPRAWQAAMAASPRGKQQSGTVGCRETLKYSFHRKRRCARRRQRACWSAAPCACPISSLRKVRETPARSARQSVLVQRIPTPVWWINQLHALRSGTWPVSIFFSKRGRKRNFARNQFARDARRRHDAVARRRRGWRSIAHTASLSDSANRRHVWSPDAARQPLKQSCGDHSEPKPTRCARGLEEMSPDPGTSVDRPTGRSLALHELIPKQIDHFDESRFFWRDNPSDSYGRGGSGV